MIQAKDFKAVNDILSSKIAAFNLEGKELKWEHINTFRIKPYCDFLDLAFSLIADNVIKIRIMFIDNKYQNNSLTAEQREHSYHLLYYQFLKHAFGLQFLKDADMYYFIDNMPENEAKREKFKNFLCNLPHDILFSKCNLTIKKENIYEVKSENHILLQTLDIILGSINFKLNEKDKDVNISTGLKGNRTIAKEHVYNHIYKYICFLRGGAKIDIRHSTSLDYNIENKLKHPYRHWSFKPQKK